MPLAGVQTVQHLTALPKPVASALKARPRPVPAASEAASLHHSLEVPADNGDPRERSSPDYGSRRSLSAHKVPGLPGSSPLRSELRFVANQIERAIEEAQSEAGWHREALRQVEDRIAALRTHLAPLTQCLAAGPVLMPGEHRNREISIDCPFDQATLRIFGLGPFRVWHAGRFVDDWPSLRGQAILRYLAAHRNALVSRDVLMETFWPSADPESARRNLHQAVYSLRLAFRHEPLAEREKDLAPVLFDNGHYKLNPGVSVWMDWEEFELRIQEGHRLEAAGSLTDAALEFSFALELYGGDFLEEAGYEDWTASKRASLRNVFLAACGWLGRYFCGQKEYAGAIAASERMLKVDPCNEQAHFRLMECFLRLDQRAAAIRQYHVCRKTLREELGVSPTAEMQAFFEQLLSETARTADAAACGR